MNSLPKTVTQQRRDCDLNPGPCVCVTVCVCAFIYLQSTFVIHVLSIRTAGVNEDVFVACS